MNYIATGATGPFSNWNPDQISAYIKRWVGKGKTRASIDPYLLRNGVPADLLRDAWEGASFITKTAGRAYGGSKPRAGGRSAAPPAAAIRAGGIPKWAIYVGGGLAAVVAVSALMRRRSP